MSRKRKETSFHTGLYTRSKIRECHDLLTHSAMCMVGIWAKAILMAISGTLLVTSRTSSIGVREGLGGEIRWKERVGDKQWWLKPDLSRFINSLKQRGEGFPSKTWLSNLNWYFQDNIKDICYEVAYKIIKAGKSGRKYSKVGIVRSVVNYVFSVKSAYMSFGYLFKTRYPWRSGWYNLICTSTGWNAGGGG